MFSSPYGGPTSPTRMDNSPMGLSPAGNRFGTIQEDSSKKPPTFLFGGNKRRSIALTSTHNPYLNTSTSSPARDTFASPLPAHLKESGSGKNVHWSPALVQEKTIASGGVINSSATPFSPATNGPPLRSLRDDVAPPTKTRRQTMPVDLSLLSQAQQNVNNQTNTQQTASPYSDGCAADNWVSVFGFPTSEASNVLKYFSRHGEIVQHQNAKKLSLKVPIPEFNKERGNGKANYKPFETKVTKLENGIRVASEEHYGEYCTIGVTIECGPRYEASFTKGVSHFLEKLAFSSSLKHGSRDEIYSVIEKNGALVDCQSTKDTFIYAASCHREGLESIMEIISNSVWRCNISPEELEEARLIVNFENEDIGRKINCEPLLTDWIHKAAFRGNTVGFSKYCSPENIEKVNRAELFTYMSQYFSPSRIVVGGVGVPHEELIDVTRKYFDERSTIWAMQPDLLLPKQPALDQSVAQYTGGEVRVEKDLSKLALGTPYPHLAHVGLGFQGVGYRDPDFVAFCVLQSLFGGGGSFSAGGPGKGMFTRLYVNVLNRCRWMYSATAFNHSYADNGVFCVQASSPPEMIGDTLVVIADQFFVLADGVEDEELNRAKIQLKSQLMMNLEVRPVMFEDLCRQIVGHGYRKSPQEYMAQIDAITKDDVLRVAERMLNSRPSLVGYGVLKHLQPYEKLDSAVAKRSARDLLNKPKAFSFN